MRNWWLIGLLFLGCERPFIETSEPELVVVEPDLTEVQTSRVITLRVRSIHFRPVQGVLLNGVSMDPAPPGPTYWQASINLRLGLNTFFLEATDQEGVSRRDTAYAAYLPHLISQSAPALPDGRGGHSLVRLRNGNLMVTGGTRRRGSPAQGESFLLNRVSGTFSQMQDRLRTPRTGHTATVLPDGQILIVGGSRIDSPSQVSDLIETVELYTPAGREPAFNEIPVQGQPIRRTNHVAIVRETNDEWLLDLIGGYGDVRYGSNPSFGVRRDLRTFRVELDGLTALNTITSAPFIDHPISGHTVTEAAYASYFILGSQFDNGTAVNGNMRIEYPHGSGRTLSRLPGLLTPRTAHATAPVLSGLFAVFGGRLESSEITTDIELLHEQTDQFFSMKPSQAMVSRYHHTAISVGIRSVILIGGFNQNGTAITASEYFIVSPE